MLGRLLALAVIFSCAAVVVACASTSEGPDGENVASTREPLSFSKVSPLTSVDVKGVGALDLESDYLPQVVCCENGAAPREALRAQAVMARTYLYFRYWGEGVGTASRPLSGTTADQAYFCSNPVSDACRDAVSATEGQIEGYEKEDGGLVVNVSFYVDGPRPSCLSKKSCACAQPSSTTPLTPDDHPSDCDACFTFSSQGAANPAYVTYNWANSGADVTPSSIGSASNESNRGCASQNIEACLAYAGWKYPEILKAFYGQDLTLRYADGSEVAPSGTTSSGSITEAPVGGSSGGTRSSSGDTAEDDGCAIGIGRRPASSGAIVAGLFVGIVAFAGVRRATRTKLPKTKARSKARRGRRPASVDARAGAAEACGDVARATAGGRTSERGTNRRRRKGSRRRRRPA